MACSTRMVERTLRRLQNLFRLVDWDIVFNPDERPDDKNLAEVWYDFGGHAATIVVSEQLTKDNLEPTLAHEMAHIRLTEVRSVASSVKQLIADEAGRNFYWDIYSKVEEKLAERIADMAVELDELKQLISETSRRT